MVVIAAEAVCDCSVLGFTSYGGDCMTCFPLRIIKEKEDNLREPLSFLISTSKSMNFNWVNFTIFEQTTRNDLKKKT